MKQTHHIGYVQTPSVKNLSNVKNALVENGLVSLTTPNEMLPDAIVEGLKKLEIHDFGMIHEGKYRIRYFDIDGKILKIEYVAEGGKLTPPTKTPNYDPGYLIFDEWNYDIENYVVEQPTDVGATYKTVDDATYMFCRFTTNTGLNPNLAISGFTSIDWGDGNIDTNKTHTYTKEGEYLIKIVGKINLTGTSNSVLLGDQNRTNALIKCYLGDIGTIGTFTFGNAYFLEQLVLPKNEITSLTQSFLSSSKITYFTVPRNITTLGNSCFYLAPLENISIPNTVTDIGEHALQGMQIKNISLPNIPNIRTYCFYNNKQLGTLICPKTITYFQASCLYGCSTLKNLIIKSTTVPGLYDPSAINRSGQLIIWVNDDIIENLKAHSQWQGMISYIRPLSWYPSLTDPNAE